MNVRDRALLSAGVLHAAENLTLSVLSFLVLATRELIQGGVRQALVFSRDEDTPAAHLAQFDPQVHLVEIERSGRWHWPFARSLRAELSSRRYDAIHLHASRAGIIGRLALGGLQAHPPVFYSPHGLARPTTGATAGRMLDRMAAFSACYPVGSGRNEARELERLTRRSAALIENSVDASFFDIERQPEDRPLVLTVQHERDLPAARAFAELAARFYFAGEPVRFRWIGPDVPQLTSVLHAAGVEVLTGLDGDTLRTQLAAAHVFVKTSRQQHLPLAVTQAMAAGVPCVLTDVPTHRDLVSRDTSGLLAREVSDMAEQVERLLQDPEYAARLGAAAQGDAFRRFHPRRFRQALLSLYRLDGARGPAGDTAALDAATS